MTPFVETSGFFRAKVIDNNDDQKFGRVRVWIPDFMPTVQETKGIWARPANNLLGGRNKEDDCNYYGSCLIPAVGSWWWIFFENGNINRPYYFAPLDIENAAVLPECRGGDFWSKWVIYKSPDGRSVVISDDPDDSRVEITGKKRQISEPPSGDEESVYTIDGNQTTILLDERDGKQKLLVRTYKGDFIHVDIDERQLQIEFEGDIKIKTNGTFCLQSKKLNIKVDEDAKVQATTSIDIKAGAALNAEAGGALNLRATGKALLGSSGAGVDVKASGVVAIDGSSVSEMGGAAALPDSAADAAECDPKGERDT